MFAVPLGITIACFTLFLVLFEFRKRKLRKMIEEGKFDVSINCFGLIFMCSFKDTYSCVPPAEKSWK